MDTTRPVSEEVADVFRQALQQRGLLRDGVAAPYRINLVVRRYDADQIVGLGARADITMQVQDGSGRTIYEDAARTSSSETRLFTSGIFFGGLFAAAENLRLAAQAVLVEAIDKLLDNPAFRAAVQGGATIR